jgi:hypothetical protein
MNRKEALLFTAPRPLAPIRGPCLGQRLDVFSNLDQTWGKSCPLSELCSPAFRKGFSIHKSPFHQ